MKQLILGLVGMPASGKSTVAKYLESKGGKKIYVGQVIWDFLEKRGFPKTQESGMMAALELKVAYHDMPIINFVHRELKKHSKDKLVIVDSVRYLKEVEVLRRKYPNFYMIATVAGPNQRAQREIARERFNEKITLKKFKKRDAGELDLGIGKAIAVADFYIDANKSKRSMYLQTDQIIKALRKSK